MFRKLALVTTLLLSALTWQAAAAVDLPPASQWIPQDALVVLEVSRPAALLEPLLDEEMTAAIAELPIYKEQAAKKDFKQLFQLVKFLEITLDMEWQTVVKKLLGGGVTIAVCPKETVLLFVDAEDETVLRRLHEMALNIARSEAEKKGQEDRVASVDYKGVKGWTFNGEEAHAIVGNRLIFSNRPEGLKAALELRAAGPSKSLAATPAYRGAQRAMGAQSAAMALANLDVLKRLPAVEKVLKQERQNPLAALLLAGITEAVRASNHLALGLEIEDETLVLRALLDGKTIDPEGPAAFALPAGPGEGSLPNLPVPRRVAAMSLYRDLHRFYAAKDDLFPERTSGLIFFENMMGIFFSGRDLTDEVLSKPRPQIRVVVAEQEYDPAVGTPRMKIPAFAVVARLQHPTDSDEMVEEAWQKAVGLVSFTRGQQALPGLIIDRLEHAGTKFTMAYFSAASIEDKQNVHERYNFRPALAMPADYLILSSTDALARDVIDALKQNPPDAAKPLAATHSLVEIDGDRLAAVLESNREAMVRQNMVEKGNTPEEAETAIDLLLAIVGTVKHLKLSVGTQQGLTRARLEAKLKLP